jgi:hypothetical protein
METWLVVFVLSTFPNGTYMLIDGATSQCPTRDRVRRIEDLVRPTAPAKTSSTIRGQRRRNNFTRLLVQQPILDSMAVRPDPTFLGCGRRKDKKTDLPAFFDTIHTAKYCTL